jgi:NitT/TauT family transport system substrate-binding protein
VSSTSPAAGHHVVIAKFATMAKVLTRGSFRRRTCFAVAGLFCALSIGTSAQEQPVIHVALSSFEAQANVYYAQDLGLLKKAGLNVDIQQVSGSAAIVAGIVSGTLQIGTGSALPVEIAHERGFDVVFVAPGTMSDIAQITSGMVVAANSPLHTAKDLTGKSVGVNALQSVDQIEVEAWTDKNGGDSRTLKFVEVPPSLIVDALESGRIDVAEMADPNWTMALTSGRVRSFAYGIDAIAKRFMVTAWFATRQWANANPEALHKFADALNQASAWAVKNPEAAAAVLRKYLHTTTTVAHEHHARSLDPALLQPLADQAYKYGTLPRPLNVREMIWP